MLLPGSDWPGSDRLGNLVEGGNGWWCKKGTVPGCVCWTQADQVPPAESPAGALGKAGGACRRPGSACLPKKWSKPYKHVFLQTSSSSPETKHLNLQGRLELLACVLRSA